MTSEEAVSPVELGWAELERGSWQEAARRFDEVLAAADDEPRALEGRAWAAWWLNDAATLFDTRERAFHAYRARGDLASSARAAIWLGCDHHEIRGEHAIANGWYQRARRLLEDLPTTAEHAWLAFQEGAYAIELADDTETAKARAAEAVAIGRSLPVTDLVFLGLALEGLALVTEGAVEAGMRCLDEASVAATSGELQERIATTWTLCYLIYACERVRDFDRTTQWCKKMKEAAAKFAFEAGVGICRVHYGAVLVYQGEWERAERELELAATTFAAVRPLAVPESEARLGELRRRQGRMEEATQLFTRAVPHPLAVLGLACLALDRGDAAGATEVLDDLIDSTPKSSVTQLADALCLMAEARAALGQLEAAEAAALQLEAIASAVNNRPLAAMAAAARGAAAMAAGDDSGARRCYEGAAELFERGGLPYEAACARGQLAVALAHLGRGEAAAAQAATAARQLRRLGAAGAAARIEERNLEAAKSSASEPTIAGLTPREGEVLALLAEGLTDREMAERLMISSHTVHRHVSNILTKLAVPSRAAAAAFGARHGVGG